MLNQRLNTLILLIAADYIEINNFMQIWHCEMAEYERNEIYQIFVQFLHI